MHPRLPWSVCLSGFLFIALSLWIKPILHAGFRAGASAVDIAPQSWPVRVNAMFTERAADHVEDALWAKSLSLGQGNETIILCVVDTCMMPRDLIDQAKQQVQVMTGVSTDRMMVSATHTHSAPSAMGCLGSRVDPAYARLLPSLLAQSMIEAFQRMKPARLAWAQKDDWDHTFNRRWIRRPDRVFADPFGGVNVRAHMHPGHESLDAIAPSGPVDPELSVLGVQSIEGEWLALLANYSMHYFGSPLLSADYYGRFAHHLADLLDAGDGFVAMMSQGTSGDLMWMDYSAPQQNMDFDAYGKDMAKGVAALCESLHWMEDGPMAMAQKTLNLAYRVPGPDRLEWARERAKALGDRLPQSQADIYALEALHLDAMQQTELILQACRVGDLAWTAIPNEVFALTGLKIKHQSPFAHTFNIELANGAEGYIPPPEQHALGGYTTWPARTAGLEQQAEPRMTEAVLALLEEVTGQSRRSPYPEMGAYAEAVLKKAPMAYWRMEDMQAPTLRDETGHHPARAEEGVAFYLPGVDDRTGHRPPALDSQNAFNKEGIHRSVHFAGGRMRTPLVLGDTYTIETWLWNGLAPNARAVTGYLYSRGKDGESEARGEHLGIGGTALPELAGRLFLYNGNHHEDVLGGHTTLTQKAWHHVVLVREGKSVRVHLDGNQDPEMEGEWHFDPGDGGHQVFFGGRSDGLFNLEGRLDEVAVYPRALTPETIHRHYLISGQKAPTQVTAIGPVSQPVSPEAALESLELRKGFRAELVVSEPLVKDPVAIDWDEEGRLWVVEMADYPLGMDGAERPGGRVRVIRDTDGDQVYDQQTLFADQLSFPTGILTWRGGVLVTAAPEILFLQDTNGDGVADRREVLVRGLTTGNQQLRANGLRWGLDGWVYCAAGGHHGRYGLGNHLETGLGSFLVGARDFRFRPDTGELEPLTGPSQNGRNRDDWGRWYGTQNSRALWHVVLPDRYLRRHSMGVYPAPTQLVVTPLNPRVFPASPQEKRFHSYEQAGHFTSACGGMVYQDRLLFPDAEGPMHAFTCEPFHNLVQHNLVVDQGVSFAATRDVEGAELDFFASRDPWCRPVMTRTGPEGALWVVDMYRYMIEHPQWLPEAGKQELLPNYRLGEDRGRIYRILPEHQPAKPLHRFSEWSNKALVDGLVTDHRWVRDKIHMMLVWKTDPEIPALLEGLLEKTPHLKARLHAMWILKTKGHLAPKWIYQAWTSKDAGMRCNGLVMAEDLMGQLDMKAALRLVDDPDPKVRLQLALSLGEGEGVGVAEALARLASKDGTHAFFQAAILSSLSEHLEPFTRRAMDDGMRLDPAILKACMEMAMSKGQRAVLERLMRRMLVVEGRPSASTLASWSDFFVMAAQRRFDVSLLGKQEDGLAQFWRRSTGSGESSIFTHAARILEDRLAPQEDRIAAIGLLLQPIHPDEKVTDLLRRWLDAREDPLLQEAAIQASQRLRMLAVAEVILDRWEGLSPALRQKAMDTLMTRDDWIQVLLDRQEAGTTLSLDAIQRDRLLRHGEPSIRQRAKRAFEAPKSRSAVLEAFQPVVSMKGQPDKGQEHFQQRCAACHLLDGLGQEIGPSLISVSQHPVPKLLRSILDPSWDVQPGYQSYHCELKDGTELYGMVVTETGSSITLKSVDGRLHGIARETIDSLRGSEQSLMPEGLEEGMSLKDMADLIAFLTQKRQGRQP